VLRTVECEAGWRRRQHFARWGSIKSSLKYQMRIRKCPNGTATTSTTTSFVMLHGISELATAFESDRIMIYPNLDIDIIFMKQFVRLLQAPYPSQCINYPRTQRNCREGCIIDYTNKQLKDGQGILAPRPTPITLFWPGQKWLDTTGHPLSPTVWAV